MNAIVIIKIVNAAVDTAAWWARYLQWKRERNERRASLGLVAKVLLLGAVAFVSTAATCRNELRDLEQYCRERPWECGGGARPTPTPDAAPTVPMPLPTVYCSPDRPCDCYVCIDSAQDRIGLGPGAPCVHPAYRGCAPPPLPTPMPWPTVPPAPTFPPAPTIAPVPPTPTPTSMPLPTPAPTPISISDPWCVDLAAVPLAPVPIFAGISQRCRRADGFIEIVAPDGVVGCQRDWDCADGNNAFRPGPRTQYSLSQGGPDGVHRCTLDEWPGPGYICDAGRRPMEAWHRTMDSRTGEVFYPGPEKDGYLPKPWESTGACRPRICAAAPTPVPVDECARAIAGNAHFLVGGGGAHAWHPVDGGRVRVVLDSTWRPICDTDHMLNWNNPDICGKCSHDPDYTVPEGAQVWTVEGAEDRGWNPGNAAQRVIVGPAGGTVRVTICPRPGVLSATGVPIPIGHGDGCSRPDAWTLPSP